MSMTPEDTAQAAAVEIMDFLPDGPRGPIGRLAIAAIIRKHHCPVADLYAALAQARRYVELAYECAFPDESENERVLAEIDAALAKARGEGEKS